MPRSKSRHHRQHGFTLYELLVAMALMLILVLMAMFGWRLQIAKAHDAQRKESLHQLQLAFAAYRDDFGCFPPPEQIYCDSTFLDPYLPNIPCDPSDNDTYNFNYIREECDSFTMYTKLENEADEDISELGCTNGCGPDENYNYYITSADVPATGTNVEGARPSCGINADSCSPNICSECCPGSNYRCNPAGNWCIFDQTCSP